MWPFKNVTKKKKGPKPLRTIKIQASAEGGGSEVIIESLLTSLRLNVSIPGTINAYTTYDSQIGETYRKYNGFSSFGTQQTRAIVDLRTAFISGEGLSISCEDENTSEWIEDFLYKNKLNGPNFINAVKGTEMVGQCLYILEMWYWHDKSLFIKVKRFPYTIKDPYRPVYGDSKLRDPDDIIDIQIKKDGIWVSSGYMNFIYTRTGGDDSNSESPTTRIGIVLTDIENYDRAIKDMRRNNHIFARITPTWETENDNQTMSIIKQLEDTKWKIGDAFVGTAKFKYNTPQSGAHENLETELKSTIKTISSVTGIPVHWLGFVDLMSNRATAQTLYEFIKNATVNERTIWSDSIYQMILKAQELYIDSGGIELRKLDKDFEVRIPLIDFAEFLNRVKGLSLAFTDEAISIDDYRNNLPGIDPLKTKRAVEQKTEEEKQELLSLQTFNQGE